MAITPQDLELLSRAIRSLAADLQSDAQERMRAAAAQAEPVPRPPAEQRPLLQQLYATYTQRNIFRPGDVVRWKRGMQNRRFPSVDELAVVIEVLTSPVVTNEQDSGSPYFKELLDIRLGVLADRGTLSIYFFDSSRFELATEERVH